MYLLRVNFNNFYFVLTESMNYPKWPPLEYCVAHANELLKVMAQASLGACAFVNIADVFPKN